MNHDWLSLKDAAALLGVHPGTVRKWSNEGKLPVHLTSGGHRRYLASEVDLWRRSQVEPEAAESGPLLQHVILSVRLLMREQQMEKEGWFAHMDDGAREYFRASGRTLAHAMITYLTVEGEDAVEQARGLGTEYALRCQKQGLKLVEAAQAFLFFRRLVFDAVGEAYRSARITSPDAWGTLLHKYSHFADQVLVAILENYH